MRQGKKLRFEQVVQETLSLGGVLSVSAQLFDQRPLSRDMLIDLCQMMLRLMQVLVSQSHGTITPAARLRCTCEKNVHVQ